MTTETAVPKDRTYRIDLSVLRNTVFLSVECEDTSTDLVMPGYQHDPIFGPANTLGDRIESGAVRDDVIAAHAYACDGCQRAIALATAWAEKNA